MLTVIFKVGGIAITTQLITELLKTTGRSMEAHVVSIIGYLIVTGILIAEVLFFMESVQVFSNFIN